MIKINNSEKMDLLKSVVSSLEEATMFSAQEFMRGEGLEDEDINRFYDDNLYNFPLALRIIEEFSDNSDQDPKEFLRGEGLSEEEIEYILSANETSKKSVINDHIALEKAGLN